MMRKFLLSFLLLINMAGVANAQKVDTLRNVSIQKIYDLIKVKGKPLVVIDGFIYKADSKPFDIKNISAIEFLKPPGSTNIYGSQAVDGAILITADRSDTASYTLMKIDSAIYILDGELSSKNKIDGLKPEDIISIDILKKGKMSDPSLSQVKGDIVVVITKHFAINQYQKKFGAFSAEYIKYLKLKNGDESRFKYVVDGNVLLGNNASDIVKKLYAIPGDKIKKVTFIEKSTKAEYLDGTPVLVITTK